MKKSKRCFDGRAFEGRVICSLGFAFDLIATGGMTQGHLRMETETGDAEAQLLLQVLLEQAHAGHGG